MGVYDLVRDAFASPATRRLRAAEQAAEVWASAPAPSRSLIQQPPAKTPPIDWTRDQPRAAPSRFTYQPGYSEHEYQQFSAPLAFDGFSLERIRAAVAAHRYGVFWETSALMVAILSFAPVFAALQQAIAPILALPRHVHGGDKGLAKLVGAEVEEQLVPRRGLLPSPYFPPTLWGTTAIYLRMMGFGVWQHVDGDADAYTGVRPRFTRIWEPWAVQRQRSPRKAIAYTTEGSVEICNDGKFTLVEDTTEGHLYDAAVLCLGEETLDGKLTEEARASFLDFFGKPKLWAKLPATVPTEGQAGDQFLASVDTIYGPDGRGILPDGSDLKAVSISGEGAQAFQGALLDAIVHIFMALTGSAGTIGNGLNTGAGVGYQPAKGGAWNVAHHLIARPTLAMVRATNQGHSAPYCDQNYGDQIERAKRAGTWEYPVLSVPLPNPDRDERINSLIKREEARGSIIEKRRQLRIRVDQDELDKIADDLELRRVPLAEEEATPATRLDLAPTDLAKVVRVDEARASRDLPPLGDERGQLTIMELEALGKAPKENADGQAAEDQDPPPGAAPDAPPQESGGGSDG